MLGTLSGISIVAPDKLALCTVVHDVRFVELSSVKFWPAVPETVQLSVVLDVLRNCSASGLLVDEPVIGPPKKSPATSAFGPANFVTLIRIAPLKS